MYVCMYVCVFVYVCKKQIVTELFICTQIFRDITYMHLHMRRYEDRNVEVGSCLGTRLRVSPVRAPGM